MSNGYTSSAQQTGAYPARRASAALSAILPVTVFALAFGFSAAVVLGLVP